MLLNPKNIVGVTNGPVAQYFVIIFFDFGCVFLFKSEIMRTNGLIVILE